MRLSLLDSATESITRVSNSCSFKVTGMTFNNANSFKRFGFYKGYNAEVINNIIKYKKTLWNNNLKIFLSYIYYMGHSNGKLNSSQSAEKKD